MSDPMTNTEVEDVLASIRRLVSDDKRPESEPAQAAATDRLVLTPSLRVMDDDSDEPPSDTVTDEDHSAEAVDADGPEYAGDAVSDDTDISDEAEVETDIVQMSIHDAFAAEIEDEQAEAEPESAVEDAVILEDAAIEHEDSAEPEESVDDEGDADIEMSEGDDAEDVQHSNADEDVHVEVAEDTGPDTAEPEQTLSDKIAALETLIGGRDEEFEPDDPGTDEYAGTEPPAMSWEDADEAPAYGAFAHAQATPDEEQDSQAQIFSSDEDVLDEDALRELVSDIVREELQGALGERITRNVRKLVRREIHRALAAQELE